MVNKLWYMTSNSVIHEDQWCESEHLSAVFKQLCRWLRLKSKALEARLVCVCFLRSDPDGNFHFSSSFLTIISTVM